MALTYWRNKLLATGIRTVAAFTLSSPAPKLYDEEIAIRSRDPGRSIKAHVYRSAKGKDVDGPRPVILNFHGSGFILRVHGEDYEFCRYVAQNSEYTVLDVSYRLAPEDPFPAALNDVEDAVRWVVGQQQGGSSVYDAGRIVLSGFSAGACLSLAAAAVALEPGVVNTVLAFYPPTDLSRDPYAKKAPSSAFRPIPPAVAAVFDWCYIPAGVDAQQPGVSPLFAAPERFPANVLIVTCDADTLCGEGEELAAKLKAQQPARNVVLRRVEGCPHAWDKRPVGEQQIQARDEAYKLALDFLPK